MCAMLVLGMESGWGASATDEAGLVRRLRNASRLADSDDQSVPMTCVEQSKEATIRRQVIRQEQSPRTRSDRWVEDEVAQQSGVERDGRWLQAVGSRVDPCWFAADLPGTASRHWAKGGDGALISTTDRGTQTQHNNNKLKAQDEAAEMG
jgi:hypothetical protein